ncbi:hypothetical protein TNCV_1754991, partial [Trichonephila clavipes]
CLVPCVVVLKAYLLIAHLIFKVNKCYLIQPCCSEECLTTQRGKYKKRC